MSSNGDYVSIKEYAEIKGITQQAVYKSISAGRLSYKEKNGKKYIFVEETEEQKKERVLKNEQQQIIDILIKQLDEKDKQIAEKDRQLDNYIQLLQEQMKLSAEINKTNETIAQALQDIARIAQNGQQLQAHTQTMLEEQTRSQSADNTEAAPVPDAPTDAARGQEKKQPLFFRLFRKEA